MYVDRDTTEEDPREVEVRTRRIIDSLNGLTNEITQAAKHGLNYIGMDGNIGCMGKHNTMN